MIPEVAIEAAAHAVYQHVNRAHFEHGGWDAVSPQWQANYRREAKLVLEAAAPLILAATVAEVRVNHDHLTEGGNGYSAGFHFALTAISGGES